jgi:hypothetical protein
MPTTTDTLQPLGVRPLVLAADAAPAVVDSRDAPERPGRLSSAFATAAKQTSGALRTAARPIRAVF